MKSLVMLVVRTRDRSMQKKMDRESCSISAAVIALLQFMNFDSIFPCGGNSMNVS